MYTTPGFNAETASYYELLQEVRAMRRRALRLRNIQGDPEIEIVPEALPEILRELDEYEAELIQYDRPTPPTGPCSVLCFGPAA